MVVYAPYEQENRAVTYPKEGITPTIKLRYGPDKVEAKRIRGFLEVNIKLTKGMRTRCQKYLDTPKTQDDDVVIAKYGTEIFVKHIRRLQPGKQCRYQCHYLVITIVNTSLPTQAYG